MNFIQIISAAALVLLACVPSHAQDLRCLDIATALKEFSISTSSKSYTNSVFDSYCETNGTVKKSERSVGLDAVVKSIPFSFKAGATSNEQAISNFCSTYSGSTALQERANTYEERIAGKSLDTVKACLELQALGVTITHRIITRRKADFFLKSSVDLKLNISGISLDGPVRCSGNVGGVKRKFDDSTSLVVQNAQSFYCTRFPRANEKKQEVFDEAVVSVATQKGNYTLVWPRDERLPEDMATSVARDLDAAKGTVFALSRTVDDQRRLISDLSRQATEISNYSRGLLRWKGGNNGSRSCESWCNDANAPPGSEYKGECLTAIVGLHTHAACSIPNYGGPVHCLCTAR